MNERILICDGDIVCERLIKRRYFWVVFIFFWIVFFFYRVNFVFFYFSIGILKFVVFLDVDSCEILRIFDLRILDILIFIFIEYNKVCSKFKILYMF